MKKPKCPWKPPFKFVVDGELWETQGKVSVVDLNDRIIAQRPIRGARAIVYALNLAYPAPKRKGKRK